MRIVIDLQAAQSNSSRHRGIGRYAVSLVKSILRQRGAHEVVIALNGTFLDSIQSLRTAFEGLIEQSQIVVWPGLTGVSAENPRNAWRRHAAELLRESFLNNLKPDVLLISSLFEGLNEDAVTSIGSLPANPISYKTAVILYDLIPYIHRHPYLENPGVARWYLDKVSNLQRSNLLLSISASSRQEAIDHLSYAPDNIVNVSGDADACFRNLHLSVDECTALRSRYSLKRSFVMYTGGIDHRKNIEGLIRSFSNLPEELRASFQLAIVCSVSSQKKQELLSLAIDCGLGHNDVVMTGFVPEADLVALYNLCTLFIFPSLHEGFGLPALEAMRCGAPVIASRTSSLPEVIGNDTALFDAHSDEAITAALERALIDPAFRSELIEKGAIQASHFSWDESAKKALEAMTQITQSTPVSSGKAATIARPKLAYVSPLPPERSGIADYSAELLPALYAHYDIDVIVDQATISNQWVSEHCPSRTLGWFSENADTYDRILYHIGNSEFHKHMFPLLKTHPGVVVLHDFFLSGIAAHMEMQDISPGFWSRELFLSHGYRALHERFQALNAEDIIFKYPCNLSVIQDSLGIIVHSTASKSLGHEWYGIETNEWITIPLMRDPDVCSDKRLAREALGFSPDDFIVCSFGILGPSKLNHRLLEGWLNSKPAGDPRCHLIFVGENSQGVYGIELTKKIKAANSGNRIRITGWADSATFRNYLNAADLAVQLRGLSRGETSGTVLDCMNHGLATIANANGSMAELDRDSLWLLPDNFSDTALVHALDTLYRDIDRRKYLGQRGRELILRDHNPDICSQKYFVAIESFYKRGAIGPHQLIPWICSQENSDCKDADLVALADAIDRGFPQRHKQKQLLLDVSFKLDQFNFASVRSTTGLENKLRELLLSTHSGFRIDLIYTRNDEPYRYGREAALKLLGCPSREFYDEPLQLQEGDVVIQAQTEQLSIRQKILTDELKAYGIRTIICDDELEEFLEKTKDFSTFFSNFLAQNVDS